MATAVAGFTLAVAVVAVIAAAPWRSTGFGLELDAPWIPALEVRMHLGLDGVSAPLVLLTALLGVLVCWHGSRVVPPGGSHRGLLACVLAVVGGALATFTALDLVVFFVAFEIVLVPMWFVVAVWGDADDPGRRRDAAYRFILFTALGSAVMLLGLLLVALRAGTTDLVLLAEQDGSGMSPGTQVVAAVLLVVGLGVKAPVWPLHTWLPPAHTIAPTVGSVLLAGVLLKMGTYGLVRVVVPVVPHGMTVVAPWLAALGVVGILWGGLACLVERDLKRLVAYSSVAHMGFVLLGIASGTPQGLQGALFANVAHGVITGLLFLVVGALKDRHHTADLAALGSGLRDRMPRLGWLLALAAVAGLGLPGLAGFWGELLAIYGAWSAAGVAGGPLAGWFGIACAVLAALGSALAAAYLLRVLRSVWHGPRVVVAVGASGDGHPDATGHELAVMAPLALLTFALGLAPWLLLDVTEAVVLDLLSEGTR